MFNIVRDFSRPPRKYKGFVSSTFKPEGKIAYVNLRASILIHTCNNIYNLHTGIIAEIPVKTRKTFLKQQDDHMKIALLGGSGFIGTEFIRQFGEQHDIFIGDIVKSTTYPERSAHCDIRRKDDLRAFMKGADVVINLAAVHRDDVRPLSLYHDTNVQGSQNICDVADELGIKHQIFTSSVAVYGFQPGEPDEDTPHKPFNPYGKTKSEAEDVYLLWQRHAPNKRALTIIRPTVVFGPNNRGNVYNLLRQIASGAFVMIGDGKNKKSMCYVGNVASFIKYSLGFGTGVHVYNYVDKPDFTMNELVKQVRETLGKGKGVGIRLPYWAGYSAGACFDALSKITGKTFPVSRIRIEKFCANTVFNADKAHSSGFNAPTNLQHALSATLEHEFGEGKQ